jgi:CRP-like cAMP-binding protein
METLRKQINEECQYKLSEELLDRLLASAVEVRTRSRQPLIRYGQFDDNIYILKEGIVRFSWFDGANERVWGFATPGTMMIPYHCYYLRRPSFYQLEACRREVVTLKISKKELDNLIDTSHEFAKWMLNLSLAQLTIDEIKHSLINGTARERFEALIKNRPEILAEVSLGAVASYLGITQAYLSRLKKEIL